MAHNVRDIAGALGAQAVGNLELVVAAAAEPASAGPDDLALAMNPTYAGTLSEGKARVALLWQDADWQALGLEAAVLVPRPRFAMAAITAMLDPGQGFNSGTHPMAFVDPAAVLGDNVSVGPFSVIAAGAQIGADSVIGPQCYVGQDCRIGPRCYLREGVRIGARVQIGARFIAQPGVVIGGDGFSFVTPEESAVERVRESLGDQGAIKAQSYVRIHSLGSVEIGDDVEVGANSCVDRGTVRATRIGNGTKIDNLVQIGHNVEVGQDCLLCGQVGIAGSSRIGNNVVLAGQCGVNDNIFIGDNVVAGGGSKILSNVPAGRVLLGYPATKMEGQLETYKSLRRLPRLLKDVAALKKAVFNPTQGD